jgi:Ricin-type beta-trefoil lectin domain-like
VEPASPHDRVIPEGVALNYQVVNAASGKCMSVQAGSTAIGANLAQSSCSPLGRLNNQSWIFHR